MNKNASFITIDLNVAKHLYDKIQAEHLNGSKEFLQGLENLINGEVATLMLGIDIESQNILENMNDRISVDELEIFPRSRKVLRKGAEISLTPKEFDILYFLAKNKGDVFTKEQIYQAVWEEDYLLADSNIMAFIRKLRKKIEYNPDEPEFIITIWGIGYKFNDKL